MAFVGRCFFGIGKSFEFPIPKKPSGQDAHAAPKVDCLHIFLRLLLYKNGFDAGKDFVFHSCQMVENVLYYLHLSQEFFLQKSLIDRFLLFILSAFYLAHLADRRKLPCL